MKIIASTTFLAALLIASAGCFHPKPTVRDVTARASEYGTFYQGQKLRLRKDAITNGRTIAANISLTENHRNYRITVSEFKSSPSSYPGRSILPAGTLLEVEQIKFFDNVTWSGLNVRVRVLGGAYTGRSMWLRTCLLSWTMPERYYRPDPNWLSIEEHDAGC